MKYTRDDNFVTTIFSFIFFRRRLKKILRFAILFLLVFQFSYSIAYSASSYYVDNSVASSGNGSQGSPWKNLSNINWTTISGASKPCTIYVSGGATSQTYNETLSVGAPGTASTYPYSGTPTSEVIVKRPSETEWSGHSGTVIVNNISVSKQYVVVDGFECNGAVVSGNPAYVTFRNLNIHNWGTFALTNSGLTSYITVQNCWIHSPSSGSDDPMQIGPINYWTIEQNLIEYYPYSGTGHADGIHFSETSQHVDIRYNIIRNGYRTGGVYLETIANATGPHIVDIYGNIFEIGQNPGTDTWTAVLIDCNGSGAGNNYVITHVYNNTFVNLSNNGSSALWAREYDTNTSNRWYVQNNIFYNSDISFFNGSATAQALTLDNNLYYSTSGRTIINWKDTPYTSLSAFKSAVNPENGKYYERNGIQSNPNLTSVSASYNDNHQLSLTAGSPCIGAGAVLGSPYDYGIDPLTTKSSWPYSVTTMARGAAYDIGAYEYGDSQPPQAPKNLRIVN